MNRWIPFAFVRIVMFFMLGVSIGIFFPTLISEDSAQVIFLSAVLLYMGLAFCVWRKVTLPLGIGTKVLAGIIGLSAILLSGFLRVGSHTALRNKDHLFHVRAPIQFFTAVVTSSPTEKANSWKLEAEVEEVKIGSEWKRKEGRMLLYLSKTDFAIPFEYGSRLLLKGDPQTISPPSNPEEFDYQRFLNFKNIYHQKFIRKGDVTQIGFAPPSWVSYYALETRKWAEATLVRNISGDREKGMASALVLGITGGLDDELLTAYKSTGTLHVLAVSGLHVGILYGLILFVLKPINRLKYGSWVLAIVSILVLWGYAFVTGLSPSVLRAVTMFSFVALAKPAGRRTNIYNTLAASAFCILMYDPFLLMSVGFQLSYLAVLGIVYMQPGLYNLWEPTNRLLDEVWKLSCVSMAAQLATFPIGLLYFHQFPNYFLLSNLLVIPASFIVLVLGIATLATSFIKIFGIALGFLLEWVIKAMNCVTFIIEDLPFGLMENLYITPLQCWILIGMILGILLLLRTRRFTWMKVTFVLAIFFSLAQWYHFEKDISIQKITIYNINGRSAIDFTDHGRSFFLADSTLIFDENRIGFHIASNRIKHGVTVVEGAERIRRELKGCSLIVWKGKSVLKIHDADYSVPSGIDVDYVIISHNSVSSLKSMQENLKAKKFILDSSNSKYLAARLLKENVKDSDKIYSVLHQGALELDI